VKCAPTANTNTLSPRVTALAIDPLDPAIVYVGMTGGPGAGLYRSTDGGAHWSKTPANPPDSYAITVLAIAPAGEHTPSTVYVAAPAWSYALFKSTDGGATWQEVFSDAQVSAVAIDPRDPSIVYARMWNYASIYNTGVFKSTDAGAHWHRISAGSVDIGSWGLVIDSYAPAILYAADDRSIFAGHEVTDLIYLPLLSLTGRGPGCVPSVGDPSIRGR
jgi:photosystem II stability/assembly factor-like uncharacterized protein